MRSPDTAGSPTDPDSATVPAASPTEPASPTGPAPTTEPTQATQPIAPDDEPRTDAELLDAHVAGDPDAFAELVTRHERRLWGIALRVMGDRDEAADALQDALIKAHRGAAGFRGDSAVTTWLHRVVTNACVDRLRRAASRPVDPAETLTLELAEAHAALDGRSAGSMSSATTDGLGDAVALRLDVEQALATLPPEQRCALVLVDVLGHDIETAASILGCPTGTVKSRCSRGRARLAPLLAHLRNPASAETVEHPYPDGTSTQGGEQG